MSAKRTRDPAYMAQKQKEYRERKKAQLKDWRTRLYDQATSPPFCPCPSCTRAA